VRDLVVHAPPYFHTSGGIRALYRLALDARALGCNAAICHSWQSQTDSATWCPFPIPVVTPASEGYREAVHLVPEIMSRSAIVGLDVVWWQLSLTWDGRRSEDRVWRWMPDGSDDRLMVEIIERDLFRPKAEPGTGVLWYKGKGPNLAGWVPHDAQQIRRSWPATREDMAATLQGADVLILFDKFTALTLEAALCGTVAVVPDSLGPLPEGLIPPLGIARTFSEVEQARAELPNVPAVYDAKCREIAGDVGRFLQAVA
jgi:hypothetical protein